jgi:arabinogalactan endo-1,4-beta-galactosidase
MIMLMAMPEIVKTFINFIKDFKSYNDKVNQKKKSLLYLYVMKNAFTLLAAATMITACVACGKDQDIQKEPEKPKEPEKIVFAEGADISWVTQMEKDGVKFYNDSGNETECTALMKEIGFDAIRLRVWVDPEDGWCGKDDVLEKARRAQALGMRLMIDFHYSDFWADPGKQNPPEAWKGYDIAQMSDAVTDRTYDILKSLQDN